MLPNVQANEADKAFQAVDKLFLAMSNINI